MPRAGPLETSHFYNRLSGLNRALARLLTVSGERVEIMPVGPRLLADPASMPSTLNLAQALLAAAETVASRGPVLVVTADAGPAKAWNDFLNSAEGSSFVSFLIDEDAHRKNSLCVLTADSLTRFRNYLDGYSKRAPGVVFLAGLDDDWSDRVQAALPHARRFWRLVADVDGGDYELGQPARLLLGRYEPEQVAIECSPRSRPSVLSEHKRSAQRTL